MQHLPSAQADLWSPWCTLHLAPLCRCAFCSIASDTCRASSNGRVFITPHDEVSARSLHWAAAAGRVFALEMAFYVSTEMVSLLLGGVLFDRLHLTTRGVAAVMACVGVCCAVSRVQGLPCRPTRLHTVLARPTHRRPVDSHGHIVVLEGGKPVCPCS